MSDKHYAKVMMKILDMAMDEYNSAVDDMIEIVKNVKEDENIMSYYREELLDEIILRMEKCKNE